LISGVGALRHSTVTFSYFRSFAFGTYQRHAWYVSQVSMGHTPTT